MNHSNSGFSLVELMMTVAIIGILGAVAVPRFQDLQRNAKRAQVKLALTSLFAAEKIFHQEFSMYSTRFDAIGFDVTGLAHFNIGFSADFNTVPFGVYGGSPACIQMCPNTCPNAYGTWTCTASSLSGLDGNLVATATRNTFLAGAHLHWDALPTSGETWAIDHTGNLFFVVPAN